MSNEEKAPNRFQRLYRGLTTIDFVGRRRTWFTMSLVVILLGLGSLGVRGFNFGIDFKGGDSWEVLAPNTTIAAMTGFGGRIVWDTSQPNGQPRDRGDDPRRGERRSVPADRGEAR